ncbi:MAG: hypothetical protein ACPG7F_15205 [Aggregatilineales bacterium]
MNEKTKRKEIPLTLNQKYGLLIVVLLVLSFTVYNTVTVSLQQDTGLDVLYLFVSLSGFIGQMLFLIVTGLFSLWILVFSLANINQRIQVKLSFAFCVIVFLCLCLSLNNLSQSFEDYALPIRHMVINEQTYRIALIKGATDSGFGDVGYAIYRCEDNLSCLLIHSEKPVNYPSIAPDISVEDDGTRIIIEIEYWQRDISSYTHSYLEISEMR